ncbi:ceeh-1 [Symbiodinium microadriaticum]|nr:ceeh-1 [Symbiodinium microadriaticum]
MAARGYTCWAPNQRGYKGSDKPKGVQEYAIEKLMDDVGNLIDASGKSETVLIAHDWGAVIAWHFAIRKIRPLEQLIIMNVPHPAVMSENMKKARRQILKSWYIFSFQIPWLPEFLMRLGGAKAVRGAFYNMAIDKSRFPDEVLDEYSKPVLEDKKALTGMINYYRAIVRGGARRQQALGFPDIETPTLMIWGEEDSALDKAMTYGTENVCKDFTIRYLPQVSHWVQQEAPEKVNAMMVAWLDGAPVRLLITMADGTDVGMDFDPDDADEIAEELKAAAQVEEMPEGQPKGRPSGMRGALYDLVEGRRFNNWIIGIILLNAAVLGLETSDDLMASDIGPVLLWSDKIMLGIFIIEIILRFIAHGWRFFLSAWHWFDLIIITIALVPAGEGMAVLRAFRVLRALRLVGRIPSMRLVVSALLHSLPGLGSTGAFMGLIFYIFAVMATTLFGDSHPQWFGTLGESAYSLFQIMTLESWSMGIVRPVMEVHPAAWAFFVPYVLITTFMVMNMVIAVLLDSMNAAKEERLRKMAEHAGPVPTTITMDHLYAEIRALRDELNSVKKN